MVALVHLPDRRDAIDRGVDALNRYTVPGVDLPTREIVAAILAAANNPDTWLQHLPDHTTIPPLRGEAARH